MRIAFVNMGSNRSSAGVKMSPPEAIHLQAMHKISQGAGHDSATFQYGMPTNEESIGAIRAHQPDVIAFSFIGSERSALEGAELIIDSFDLDNRPAAILGGTDMEYQAEHYVEKLAPLYTPNESGHVPITVVYGPGEHYVKAYAPFGFNMMSDEALRSLAQFNCGIAFDEKRAAHI